MESGFTLEHFALLERWGGLRDEDSPDADYARETIRVAHWATKDWADLLVERIFPNGQVEARRAPINQGHHFAQYTWAKIYPTEAAPRGLAYTVGIDRDGSFVVKLDVTANGYRSLYQALFGEDFAESPIAAVLPAVHGLALSMEALVDWSADAIAGFMLDYGTVAQFLGIGARLTFLTDPVASAAGFSAWRQAMLEGAIERHKAIWCPDVMLSLGKISLLSDGRYEVPLGFDQRDGSTVVNINEPKQPGGVNGLSSIAVDAEGHRYLMHQAKLSAEGENILPDTFTARTSLTSVAVDVNGKASSRIWFIVAALDQPAVAIRRETARFVDQCRLARLPAAEAASDPRQGVSRPGSDEVGGSYVIGPREALQAQIVERRHGMVYLALQELLAQHDIALDKVLHPLGFEIDGQIARTNGPPLLIEIKTGIGSSNIHAGVGQLYLYPRLIPVLKNHLPILLLPGHPHSDVVAAVRATGIAVHYFSFPKGDIDNGPVFSAEFLALCGVPD